MLTLIAGLVPGALALITFAMRLFGVKEDAIKQFEESIVSIQKRRQDATRPATEEELALEELKKLVEENKGK